MGDLPWRMTPEELEERAYHVDLEHLPALVRQLADSRDLSTEANEHRPIALLLLRMQGSEYVTLYPGAILVEFPDDVNRRRFGA